LLGLCFWCGGGLKPSPHQQQCRSNVGECYKSNDSFDNFECCFDIVAVFGANNKVEKIEHAQFVSTFSKGQNFVRHCCRNLSSSRIITAQQAMRLFVKFFDRLLCLSTLESYSSIARRPKSEIKCKML